MGVVKLLHQLNDKSFRECMISFHTPWIGSELTLIM
jgi:hypothetical protein